MFDLLSQSWFFFRHNYGYFVPALFLLSLLYLLAMSANDVSQAEFSSLAEQLQAVYGNTSFWWLSALYFVESPLLLLVARWRIATPEMSISQLFSTAIWRLWPIVLRFVLAACCIALPIGAIVGVLVMLANALPSSIVVFISLFTFAFLFYVFVRLSLVIPVLVEDGASPIYALRMSWKASYGKVATILGGYVFVACAGLVMMILVELLPKQLPQTMIDWLGYFIGLHINCLIMIFLYRLYLVSRQGLVPDNHQGDPE